jgi:protein O-mannosyl-transferase
MKKAKKTYNKKSPSDPEPVVKDLKKQEKFIINHKAGFVIALVGFLLYSNTIDFGYVLDDSAAVVENQFVKKGFAGIPDLLKTDFWYFSNLKLGYYRPLSLITFAIEYQFLHNNPQVSHLINVLLFAFTGYLLFILLNKIFRSYHFLFPFAICLLFIAHPVHTEVVANIKSRDEILSFLNVLLTLWFALKYFDLKRTKYLLLSLLFFYLALLSKETALAGVILVPVVLFFRNNISIPAALKKGIPYMVIIFLFLLQKKILLGTLSGMPPDDITNYPYTDPSVKLPTTFLLFAFSLRLLFFPHPLRYDYSFNQIPAAEFSNPAAVAGVILFMAGIAAIVKYYRTRSPMILGLIIIYITLMPSLAFTIIRGGIFAERFLFFPSLGFAVLFVSAISYLSKPNFKQKLISVQKIISSGKVFYLLIFIITALYSIKTFTRNNAWQDEITLFSTDIKSGENCTQNLRHYGTEILKLAVKEKDVAKRSEYGTKALDIFKKALVIHPKFAEVLNQMGVIFQEVFFIPDSAIYYYNKAIEASPGLAFPSFNLGTIYQMTGKNEAASFYYNDAIKKNPSYLNAIKAKEDLKKSTGLDIHVNPLVMTVDTAGQVKDGMYYYNLGNYYASRGDYVKAAELFEQSINLSAGLEDSYINLANSYGMMKEYEKSIKVSEQLLQRNPNNIRALENLAITYRSAGNNKKADECLQRASTLRNNSGNK